MKVWKKKGERKRGTILSRGVDPHFLFIKIRKWPQLSPNKSDVGVKRNHTNRCIYVMEVRMIPYVDYDDKFVYFKCINISKETKMQPTWFHVE